MDKLTALLEEHQYDPNSYSCYCDTSVELYRSSHRAHLAEMLRELLAEVWYEGFTNAEEQADGFAGVSGWPKENPYEKETN